MLDYKRGLLSNSGGVLEVRIGALGKSKVGGLTAGRATSRDKEVERELIKRAAAKDKEAYRQLVEKYQGRALSIAFDILKSREDAEDVVQESFVKAYLSLPDFKFDSNFYTWLYRIVHNLAIDLKRKIGRRGGPTVEYEDSLNSSNNGLAELHQGQVPAPDAAVLRKEQAERIRRGLEEISEEHRVVIALREIDGLSYDEISRVTGVSKGTVMSRLHYARKRLQKALSDFAPQGLRRDGQDEALENSDF